MDLRIPALLALLTASAPAFAQADVLFGSGRPPAFRDQELDRRFLKSKVHRALTNGTQDPNCAAMLGGLLTALAEAAPTFHKRDENFYLDPDIVQALNTQLTTPRFPGTAYLAAMVRRVLIDRRLPAAWLDNAAGFNALGTIDQGKLRFLAEGLRPVDSFHFTLPALRERWEVEVVRANSAAAATAELAFKDAYLDREVAWGDLKLLDVEPTRAARRKGKGADDEPPGLVATLQWRPPVPDAPTHPLMSAVPGFGKKKPTPVRITAYLADQQFLDLTRVPKGKRVLIRGRLWGVKRNATRIELREALLFEHRDFASGALLARPENVAACPFAVNELTGLAPRQPGGFAH